MNNRFVEMFDLTTEVKRMNFKGSVLVGSVMVSALKLKALMFLTAFGN